MPVSSSLYKQQENVGALLGFCCQTSEQIWDPERNVVRLPVTWETIKLKQSALLSLYRTISISVGIFDDNWRIICRLALVWTWWSRFMVRPFALGSCVCGDTNWLTRWSYCLSTLWVAYGAVFILSYSRRKPKCCHSASACWSFASLWFWLTQLWRRVTFLRSYSGT